MPDTETVPLTDAIDRIIRLLDLVNNIPDPELREALMERLTAVTDQIEQQIDDD